MSKYDMLSDAQIDKRIDAAYQRGWKAGRDDAALAMLKDVRRQLEAERKKNRAFMAKCRAMATGGKDATPRKK